MASWLLTLGPKNWRIDAPEDAAAPQIVPFTESELTSQTESIAVALREAGYRGEAVVVALESDWCLAATLEVKRPRELRDRGTMLYRFEECVPWSAEDLVGDYAAAGDAVLFVAAPQVPLAELFRRLEGQGIQVQSIVPLVLLACAEHLASSSDAECILFAHDRGVDLIRVQAGRPAAWFCTDGISARLRAELQQQALEAGRPLRSLSYGLTSELQRDLSAFGAVELLGEAREVDQDIWQLARSAADKIARGRAEPLVELRRGVFGQSGQPVALRPYRWAFQVAAGILIAAWTVSFTVRGYDAGREAENLQARQIDIYRQIFPNTQVPVGVMSRLESELAKLKGLQGGDEAVPGTVSATVLLRDFLAALPVDRRFIIHEIRLEEGRLAVDGEVRDHGDAELIAQRLRTKGFEIASPRTQRLDDKRVSLRVAGTRTTATPVAGKTR